MKKLIFFLSVFLQLSAIAQPSKNTYTFKEIGWSIIVPQDFNVINSVSNEVDIEKTKRENERPFKKDLISAFKGTNFIIASITLPQTETTVEQDYQRFEKSYAGMVKDPSIQVDSSTSIEILDGLGFKKYQLTEIRKGKIFNSLVTLAKSYEGYVVGITYMYFDENTKKEIESMLLKSKFRK